MKLIVGLGNPGLIYANSRHNIGFYIIRALSKICKVSLKNDTHTFSLSARCTLGAEDVLLATPKTFMNLSGLAVRALLKKYKINLKDLLVVCDDLDLEFARIRIRPSGSSGGHRGLKNIIDSLSSQDFCRLRIGVGRPRAGSNAAEYVLSNLNKREKRKIKPVIENATCCCRVWIEEGITKSMDIFNKRGCNE